MTSPPATIAVLGAGAWGTALAIAFANQPHRVRLWTRDSEQAASLRDSRCNRRYLESARIPESVQIETDMAAAIDRVDLVVSAVPTAALRSTLTVPAVAASDAPIFWACKGFEEGSGWMPHQVVGSVLGTDRACGALSGPSFADEVGQQMPTAIVAASRSLELAEATARLLSSPRFRVYAATDLVGVELGGALKNVIAIAGGICDGLNLGRNARAALVTRGLAEMARLGVAMGAEVQTFMGLTGLGDLLLTATGDLSRNRAVGLRLASGQSLPTILNELGHVAEGVRSARSAVTLARAHAIDMPITEAVTDVLEGRVKPDAAVMRLLTRDVRLEMR
jgi:glycerol-3-phosphate dehydrogenase (NAD(P)+)